MALPGVSELNCAPAMSPYVPVSLEPVTAVPMTLPLAAARSRSGVSAACAAGAVKAGRRR